MRIARQYTMIAAAGCGPALEAALKALADAVRPLPGCDGIEILCDAAKPDRFMFVERWASIEAHKGSAALLPKDAFAAVVATLSEKPTAAYLNELLAV